MNDVTVACSHSVITFVTEDGNRVKALSCRIESEDINDDGTITLPLSGDKCDKTYE